MDEMTEKRVSDLEHHRERVERVLFGNGAPGVDDRLRTVESGLERYDADRRKDRAEQMETRAVDLVKADERHKGVMREIGKIESALDQQVGGWRVAKYLAGFGVPLLLGFLAYIARQVS